MTQTNETLTEMVEMLVTNDDGGRLLGSNAPESIAQEWLDAGLSVENASAYIERGCWDGRMVGKLVAGGITPDDLAIASEIMDRNVGYDHSNGDLSVGSINLALDRGPGR